MTYSTRNAFADQQAGRDLVAGNVQQAGRYRAGREMQQGNTQAAAQTLYGAGDLEGGQQLQQQDQAQAARLQAYQEHTQAKKSEKAQKTIAFMKDAAKGLLSIPAPVGPDGRPDLTARREAYSRMIAPYLERDFEMPPEAVQQAADHLDDNSLHALGPDLDKQLQIVNRGGGGYDVVDQRTGGLVRSVEPTQRAPVGYTYGPDGNLQIDPGYVQGQGQITNARAAATASHRAPPRPRAAGGVRASGSAKSATGRPLGQTLDPNDGW